MNSLLHIYLNDHVMGATAGVELARRCLRNNAGTPFAQPLQALLAEISEDREALLEVMAGLAVPVNRAKVVAGLVGERLGRLKPNGRLRGYSPLSRLVEIEGLHGGVDLKLRLWRTLQHLTTAADLRVPVDLDRLIARAQSQFDRLEALRLDAAAIALGPRAG